MVQLVPLLLTARTVTWIMCNSCYKDWCQRLNLPADCPALTIQLTSSLVLVLLLLLLVVLLQALISMAPTTGRHTWRPCHGDTCPMPHWLSQSGQSWGRVHMLCGGSCGP